MFNKHHFEKKEVFVRTIDKQKLSSQYIFLDHTEDLPLQWPSLEFSGHLRYFFEGFTPAQSFSLIL